MIGFREDLGLDPTAVLSVAGEVNTPAFILEERSVREKTAVAARVQRETGAHILFAMKPLGHWEALRWMMSGPDSLSGLAASSLFEARLARQAVGKRKCVSITTPGLRADEIEEIATLCDHVVCNSLSQYARFQTVNRETSLGLRVNPQYSLVKDSRYDPCRDGSKLGEPLESVKQRWDAGDVLVRSLRGLHFHTNCDCETYTSLLRTVRRLHRTVGPLLSQLEWINLGGGYLFKREVDLTPLCEAVELLHKHYGMKVYLEPGAALVREAGYFVSSVIDLFESDDGTVAVLDTTVNHMPEVFEYQFEPDILEHVDDGPYEYTLAGSTCLSMDVFGVYCFTAPLTTGARVVFPNMGAYSMVKAHMFNGINLPSYYTLGQDGTLTLRQRFTYRDFLRTRGKGEKTHDRSRKGFSRSDHSQPPRSTSVLHRGGDRGN